MSTGGSESNYTILDYTKALITGVIVGAVNRPLILTNGALRFPQSLGLPPGWDSTNQVQFHDWVTLKALTYGVNYSITHLTNPKELKEAWDDIDEDVKIRAIESMTGGLTEAIEEKKLWLTNQFGSFSGSFMMSQGINYYLTKKMRFSKMVTFPCMMVLSFSGMMALFWKDSFMVPTFKSTGTRYDKIKLKY